MSAAIVSSSSSSNSVSIEKQLYNAAAAADFNECKRLYQEGANINMAIMGSVDGPIDQSAKEKNALQKEIWQWSIENGACMIFGFRTNPNATKKPAEEKPDSFFTRVSMRRGPGDVLKGTFAHLNDT
jgi:hypothetical protein